MPTPWRRPSRWWKSWWRLWRNRSNPPIRSLVAALPGNRQSAGEIRWRAPLSVNQTCGQSAIAFLEASGVDTVFGIPGVHTLDFYKGLAQSSIRHIGVRHEQGAGFMADGYARASGKPGVCVLITGP